MNLLLFLLLLNPLGSNDKTYYSENEILINMLPVFGSYENIEAELNCTTGLSVSGGQRISCGKMLLFVDSVGIYETSYYEFDADDKLIINGAKINLDATPEALDSLLENSNLLQYCALMLTLTNGLKLMKIRKLTRVRHG
ncbi:MAG: hypothetical protein MRY83_03870 [Flavobacteriales bacterium]|nr:hypothetical protein [Flavobacteriales bacterium]